MVLRLNRLSALAVARLKTPGYYVDGGGLVLQVTGTGGKSWIFRYKIQNRQREMGLGSSVAVDLAEARERASQCRLLLLDGHDPLVVRRGKQVSASLERARQMSFDQCAAAYIAAHRSSWKNAKHAAQWKSTLATYVSPVIGTLPVAEVGTELVVKVLADIWQAKTETATRVRGRIESILDWATVSGHRAGENPARWKGHLDNLLAKPGRIAPVKNHPALPWRDIASFMLLLAKQEGRASSALQFAILTAARSGEVRGACWSEFDLAESVWTIPAERMNARKEHRVPLAPSVRALVRNMPRSSDFVFPGRQSGTQLSDMSLTAVLRRLGHGDIAVHGFRSTFRDWCAEAISNTFSREVCEHALAHSLPDRVEAAYRRGDLFEKRILLMRAWADFCHAPPKQG